MGQRLLHGRAPAMARRHWRHVRYADDFIIGLEHHRPTARRSAQYGGQTQLP